MGGFFIPGIGAGGGGGGNLPANVITGVQLNPAQNGLTFTYSTGATTDIPLNDVVENLTASQIENVRLNGKTLVVEQVDGQQTTIALTNVLDAVDINFTPTGNIQSTNVQDAIVEIDGNLDAIKEKLVKDFQLIGNEVVLTLEDNTEHKVDLTNILGGDITDVVYDEVTYTLTVTKKGQQPTVYNLSSLIGVREFSYDSNTKIITVLDHGNQTVTVDLSKFARLDEDNIFSGDSNIFKELSLGLPNKTNYTIPSGTYGQAVTQIKTGNRAITSHTQATSNGYVKNLVARVDNITLGEKINVNIWEVTKGQDRSQDVPKLLHSNLEVEVISSAGYFATGFAIKCPINKKYNKETYFIYQILQPAKLFRATNINPTSDDYIRIDENVDVTTAAIILSRNDLVGVYLLELGDVNIGDLLDNNNGTVTSVNGQAPNDLGAVTVDAEHINYDNATSQLNATTVQGAIDELNGKFIEDITFDRTTDPQTNKPKNTLKKTKNGQPTDVVNHIVTEWQDLKHVYEITKQNIFNPVTQLIKGSYYLNSGNGTVTNDTAGVGWARTVVPLTTQGVYTIYTTNHASQTFVYLDAGGTPIQRVVVNPTTNNSVKFTKRYRLDATNHPIDAVAFGFNVITNEAHAHYVNPINEIMIFAEDLTENLNEFIPRTNGAEIIINGAKVSVGFDPSDSELLSTTVESAIKEIDNKIVTINNSTVKTVNGVNPDPVTGNVQVEIANITNLQTTLNEKVAQTDLTVVTSPDKVLQLDRNGKIDTSVLPDLSINQVYSVQSEQEAMDLINANTAQIGDVFIVEDNGNRVYMYVNENGVAFDDSCAELTMGNGVVVKVNNEVADATGNVTIRANHITLSDGTSNVEVELNKRLQTINSQTGIDGNINLSIDITDSKINFQVEGVNFGELTYIDDAQVQDIITLFD